MEVNLEQLDIDVCTTEQIVTLNAAQRSGPPPESEEPTHLLDVLQGDPVVSQLLIDEDEGVEVTHPPIEQLVRQPTCTTHYSLVVLQQSGS